MNMMHIEQSGKFPETLKKQAHQVLNELMHHVNGVKFIMLCSTDGFEIVQLSKIALHNSSKVAAVSSSILAMVSAFTAEINLVGCNTITLDAENGKVMLAAVANAQYPMVLVASTQSDVLLGQMNFYMKKAVDDLVQLEN